MRKVLSLLLCVMMVFTMMPSMAFAEAGNLPGTMYWAEADKVTGGVTQDDLDNSEIWHTTLTPQAGIRLNVIFAIKEGDAVVFVNDPTTIASGNENVVRVSGRDGNVLTLEFKEAGRSWLRASLDSGDYELGVTVSGSGGQQPPAGNPPGTMYWAEADKVTGGVTQDDLDNSEIWHTTLTPQAGIRLNVIFAIKEGDAVVFVNDPTTIASGNENVVRVSGRDGNVLTLEFKEAGRSWLRASLDSGDYELGVTVSGSGSGQQPPAGNPPEALYFIYAGNNIALGDNNVILIDGVAYENTEEKPNAVADAIDRYAVSAIESQLGGHSGYFVVKGNSALRAVYGVESSDSNIVDIRSRDNGVQEIRLKSPGTVYLTLTSDDGLYNWEMKVTGTISGLNIRGGGWTAAPGNIGNGIFMSQMEVYDGNTRLTESQYSVKLTDETIGTVGITPGNTIEFVPKAAGQTTMVITYGGQEYYYQLNVEEQDLNQGGQGGNGGGEGPEEFDIFVLSSRDDLAELTEQEIMNELDFAIIEPRLTHEKRTRRYTGYPYVATMTRVNHHWVYTGFRELEDFEKENILIEYTAGGDSWVTSLNGNVSDLAYEQNEDGTWTFTYNGVDKDAVKKNNDGYYGYLVAPYEAVPEGIHRTCDFMQFAFLFDETAPVTDGEYDVSVEALVDPEEIEGWPYKLDRMSVNGQGSALEFNRKITSWYTCFYVRNKLNDYDARYLKTPDTNEVRTYVGTEDDYILEARERGTEMWVPAGTLDAENQIYSLEYIGAKKGFYPVFYVTFDPAKDDENRVTDSYSFRIRYTGEDPYLDNGNENNSRIITLNRNESMVEFDIDEYWFDEVVQRWNTGNVLHFDYIGTAIRDKLNIRPGVMQSVADKVWYGEDDYIFIENEVQNIRFYRMEKAPDGHREWVEMTEEQCPFTVTWNSTDKEYLITYAYPERDLYGPHYEMRYIGDYDSKINEAYGYEEGTRHYVQNGTSIITPKLTVNVGQVGEDGFIDATIDEDITGTEVIFGEDAVGDQTELEIDTNDGSITLGGALVGNIKINKNKVHFKMWNVKEEKAHLTDDQKKAVDKCGKAFDFKIDTEDADIAFGEDGYATIRIPYDGDEAYIYYINEKGEKEYIACECKDGYIEFTAKHFSVYGISPRELAEGGADDDLTVLYNGGLIGSGSTIQIPECGGFSLPIYYGGQVNDGTWAMGDTSDDEVCFAGVSPDNQSFEVYLSQKAKAGDKCKVTLYYGDDRDPIYVTYKIEVTPGIRLVDGGTTVMPNGTISGKQSTTVQIVFDGEPVTSGYQVGTNGNCICDVTDLGNGKLQLTTIGNGSGRFTVWYNGMESTFTWQGSGVADSDAGARNVVMEIDGEQKETGGSFVLEGNSTFTGKIWFNGKAYTSGDYTIRTERGNQQKCSAEVNSDGTFTLTTYGINGFTNLVFEYQEPGGQEYMAAFEVQVSAPKAYILQFYNMEQLEDESWNNTGMATLGVFKKNKQEKYVKYVVTDEEMRRVDNEHYVNVTPDNLLVVYYVPEVGDYVPVPEDQIPFTFEMVNGEDHLMKITYDKGKDKYGPAYMLVYTDYASDKYMQYDSPETPADNTIFLWTRSVSDFVNWDKLQGENHRWHYNAKIETYEGFEKDNDECDVKYVDVNIQGDLFGEGENKVEIVEDQSTLEIETDLGSVIFDDKVLTQIDNTDKDVTLNILNVEKDDAEYKAFESALKKASCILDLNLSHEDGTISDFEEGKVTIKLSYELKDPGKKPHVYYVDSEGRKHLVECEYDAETKELTFNTNHFSLYEVEEKEPDVTVPEAEISIEENKWNTLLNTITFGKFFKETQTVTITAADEEEGSGVTQICYILAKSKLSEEELQTAEWTAYTGPFHIEPDNAYIIYAKAEDAAGNVVIISSEGIVLDATAPVIAGIADGGVYYGDTTFTVTEAYIGTVTVGGEEVQLADGMYTIEADETAGADGMEYIITAADKAGNSCAAVSITVIAVETLDDTIADITADNVKSADEAKIQAVLDQVNNLLSSEEEFTSEEAEILGTMKSNAQALIEKIAADQKVLNDALKAAEAVTAETVTADDAAALEAAKTKLEALAEDANYTEAEAAAMQAEIERIEDLEKVIADTEAEVKAEAEKVDAYDAETVKSEDKAAIEAILAGLTAKTEDKNLTAAQKAELTDAAAEAQALIEKIAADQKVLNDALKAAEAVTAETVTADDAAALEAAKAKLEALAEDANYTEAEAAAMQAEIERIEGLEKVIADTEAEVKAEAEKVDAYDAETVKSEDKAAIEAILAGLTAKTEDKNLTAAQKAELTNAAAEAQALIEKIVADQKVLNDALKAAEAVTIDNVKISDEDALKAAKTALEAVLNDTNYTVGEAAAVQAEIDRIGTLLEKIEELKNAGSGSGGDTPVGPSVPSAPSVNPLTAAKTEASKAVDTYVDRTVYNDAEADEIAAIAEQAKKDIEAAKSEEEVEAIEAAAKAEIDKIETAEEKALIAEVEDTRFTACSEMTALNGKRAIKVSWNVPAGMDFDGYDVFRSIKRYKGFGTKPFWTTTKTSYINNRELESGNTYYYKVRAFKYVNDEKVYTQWSYKAWRTVK